MNGQLDDMSQSTLSLGSMRRIADMLNIDEAGDKKDLAAAIEYDLQDISADIWYRE